MATMKATAKSKTVTGAHDLKKAKLDWTIHNFSFLKTKTDEMFSQQLRTGNIIWQLCMKPHNKIEKDEATGKGGGDFVQLFLQSIRVSGPTSKIALQAKFEIRLPLVGNITSAWYASHLNQSIDVSDKGIRWGWPRFIPHSSIFGTGVPNSQHYLRITGDKLILRVSLKYLEIETSSVASATVAKPIVPSQSDKQKMYERAGDFTLVTADGTEKRVHRNVLASRSNFFAKFFASNSEEVQEGRYVMAISTEDLDALLKFMYYDCVDATKSPKLELVMAANEYQVEDLKKICDKGMAGCAMDKSQAGTFLLFAEKLGLKELQAAAKRVLQA